MFLSYDVCGIDCDVYSISCDVCAKDIALKLSSNVGPLICVKPGQCYVRYDGRAVTHQQL